MRWLMHSLLVALVATCMSSCAHTLQAYERVYVNDPEMEVGEDLGQSFQDYVYSIREGATFGGTKSSGGCGCN